MTLVQIGPIYLAGGRQLLCRLFWKPRLGRGVKAAIMLGPLEIGWHDER